MLAPDLAPVWTGAQPLTPSHRVPANGRQEPIAAGVERLEPLTTGVAAEPIRWTERRRGKRRVPELPALPEAVAALVARSPVQGLLSLRYEEQGRQWSGRRYGDRPAMGRGEQAWHVTASVDPEAVEVAVRQLGWRVYATQQPVDQRSRGRAVLAYRNEALIERDMGRLQGRPLALTPLDLERDDHATGVIRLLSIGLRVLTRRAVVVRRRLAAEPTSLMGLYAGNPPRATARPTAERRLESFQAVTWTIIREGRRRRSHLTPLSRVPQRILALLDCPVDIYTRLSRDSRKPP